MRRLGLLTAVLALLLASVGTASASHAWANYHWERSSNPLPLVIGNNLTGVWAAGTYFGVALADWNQSSVLNLSAATGANLKNCGAVAGRVEVCNGSYGYRQGGWLGIAQIWASGDHIVQGVVKLNDTFLTGTSSYATNEWRQMVMCQEIGHTFGLDHQDENFDNANLGTCMDYTSNPSGPPNNLQPNAHDYEQLIAIYSHLDGTGGGGGGGNCPPRSPNCSGGAGAAPSFSEASRSNGSIYLDRMTGGMVRITFIIWA